MILVMADGLPIGIRIARRRQALGMRQEDLARKLGVSKSSVANWESGKHFPKRKLGLVEQVLGISLDGQPEPDILPDGMRDVIKRGASGPEAEKLLTELFEAYARGEPVVPLLKTRRRAAP